VNVGVLCPSLCVFLPFARMAHRKSTTLESSTVVAIGSTCTICTGATHVHKVILEILLKLLSCTIFSKEFKNHVLVEIDTFHVSWTSLSNPTLGTNL
jgi:hypothetical protein